MICVIPNKLFLYRLMDDLVTPMLSKLLLFLNALTNIGKEVWPMTKWVCHLNYWMRHLYIKTHKSSSTLMDFCTLKSLQKNYCDVFFVCSSRNEDLGYSWDKWGGRMKCHLWEAEWSGKFAGPVKFTDKIGFYYLLTPPPLFRSTKGQNPHWVKRKKE